MQCALGGFIAASNAKELPGESCAPGRAGSPRPLVRIPKCPRSLRSRLILRRKRFACSIATNSRLPARRFFRSSAATMRSACASASIKTRPNGCAWIPDAAAPWNGSLPQPNHAARLAPSVAIAAGARAHIHTDVLLGSERLAAVRTGVPQRPLFSGEAGLPGNGVLSQFRVTVDADKSRLLLDRIP